MTHSLDCYGPPNKTNSMIINFKKNSYGYQSLFPPSNLAPPHRIPPQSIESLVLPVKVEKGEDDRNKISITENLTIVYNEDYSKNDRGAATVNTAERKGISMLNYQLLVANNKYYVITMHFVGTRLCVLYSKSMHVAYQP